MAGGDSPRQKMINMMYIVLIAMLALNVDTKVLKKFIMINNSYESTNSEKLVDNSRKIESINCNKVPTVSKISTYFIDSYISTRFFVMAVS